VSANKILITIKIDNLYSPYKVAKEEKLKCRPMPNVMAALPNIGGALCSTPQSFADDNTTGVPCSNAAKKRNPLKLAGGAPNYR